MHAWRKMLPVVRPTPANKGTPLRTSGAAGGVVTLALSLALSFSFGTGNFMLLLRLQAYTYKYTFSGAVFAAGWLGLARTTPFMYSFGGPVLKVVGFRGIG